MKEKDFLRIKNKLREISSQVLRREVLKLSVKYIKSENAAGKIQPLKHHQCNTCGKWYRPEKVEVDHIKEIGKISYQNRGNGLEYGDICEVDWTFIDRMFCPISNCQILCIKCHQKKTTAFNSVLRSKNLRRIREDEDLL